MCTLTLMGVVVHGLHFRRLFSVLHAFCQRGRLPVSNRPGGSHDKLISPAEKLFLGTSRDSMVILLLTYQVCL